MPSRQRTWALGAVFALSAPGWAERPTEKCEDDHASCRETCTLEYGTQTTTRGRLAACSAQCDSRLKTCVVMVADRQRREQDAKKTDAGVAQDSDAR